MSHWKTGSTGTHRNSYPGGKYAYLSAAAPGYKGNILTILDVSDPVHPKIAGQWARPNQKIEPGAPPTPPPFGFHGPANISPDGKIATMGYAPGIINLDISDIAHPKLIGDLTMTPPFISAGSQSEHTVLPLWKKQMLFANSEAAAENCVDNALNYAVLIDNRNLAKPRLMSMFPLPVPPKDAPYKDFCDKGGRFGPHNTSQEIHLPDVEQPDNLIYLTYFNAGLQVYDIKDPVHAEDHRLLHPAAADQEGRLFPEDQARQPDRGRARRHARQPLHHRQAMGRLHPALFGPGQTEADGEVTGCILIRRPLASAG